MNFAIMIKKAPVVLILLLFVVSFAFVEGERTIRVRKVKRVAPRHISLLAKSGNGVYARRYAYGRPITGYSTKRIIGPSRRNYGLARRRRTYANKFQNWTPNRSFPGGRNNPRVDRINQQKKRKELFPYLQEPGFGPNKQKRRVRPQRFNPMQRPQPPRRPNDFDDEYFFPEEAKRAETKYEFDNRFQRPKKKRRNPGEFEQAHKGAKIPFYDEKPAGYRTRFRETPVSYSTFIQHSPGAQEEAEDFYEDPDSLHYSKPVVRNKKKRVKKKPNSKKKNKDEDYYRPFAFESELKPETYPPYPNADEYELPAKTNKKRNKPAYDFGQDQEEFVPNASVYSKSRPQVSSIFTADTDSRGSQTGAFSPSYSQSWSQASVVETTARPLQYQTENGFQPYQNVQKTKTTYYSQPDNSYKGVSYSSNYVGSQSSSANSQVPYTYSSNSYSQTYSQPSPAYSQPASPTYSQLASPTYSQPVPSSSTLTDITIQKSVPIYDNTETFYNYNNNAYVNSQSSKYYNQDNAYGSRLSTTTRTKPGEKTDSDNEFIKKHQNLYNNGLSGVPIQGDGYGKETVKKDYDIGYGDFQFDENPGN